MRQIKNILCPVDLSEVSRSTIDHAVLMAGWYEAKITALHVYNPLVIPTAAYDFALAGVVPAPPPTADEVTRVREQVRSCFNAADAVEIDVQIDSGHPANRILERARLLPSDLIVIGTHGASGFEHLVLGSVTEKVLRKATCPVMTVPPHGRTTAKLPFKRLLCPVDFSDSSLAALEFAFSLAQEGEAELTLLYVSEWPVGVSSAFFNVAAYREEVERYASDRLQALIPAEVGDWCRPTTRLCHGKAYREILGTATEDGADLIIMGVHGRNAFDLMLFGSTTNQVIRRATCPVLTLRA